MSTRKNTLKNIGLIALAFILSSCIKEKTTGNDLQPGDVIPDFTVAMSDGTSVSASELKKGKSVIVFFTTGCPDCRNTLPHVQRIYDEYLNRGVSFALISREETSETISAYWEENNFTMPFSAQGDRYIYELFARTRVPRVYINKNGIIKTIFTDLPKSPSYEDMKEAIENL